MKNPKLNCSSKEHAEIDATSYCQECKIYMCKKCEKFHSKLFENHRKYNIDKEDIKEEFTGFCLEKNHGKLKYYCKTHNILCCASCLCSIKDDEYGLHSKCDVINIEEIKDEKKKIKRKY